MTRLEKQVIALLHFDVTLKASEYAQMYFDLRSQVPHHYTEGEEFDEVSLLNKEGENKLEVLSQRYTAEYKHNVRMLQRSTGSVDSFQLQKLSRQRQQAEM